LYRNYGGANQGKKMAEIRSNWCQNGDIQQGILIKRDISMYSERSYITEVLHGQRMFNTMTILESVKRSRAREGISKISQNLPSN